jgi:AraC family transcriptional regulator
VTRERQQTSHAARQSARSHYAERIGAVIDYIHDNLDGDLSLHKLSQLANFSPFHFHRQFSAYTGITVTQLVRLLRLKRASVQLALNPELSITEIALATGFSSSESFSRAFKQVYTQTPTEFRRAPRWQKGPTIQQEDNLNTDVEIVDFPTTRVAAVEYQGPESQSYNATMKLIAWRRENAVGPETGRTYGVHYSDPATTPPNEFRLDICVSYEGPVAANTQGVLSKTIPGGRCARIRHLGTRDYMPEADYLYRDWLPASAEDTRDYPPFFHYVNVGPDVSEKDMITDIYLPLR